ncbi:MAG: hypothetical protein V1794_11740 [Candidatus Glassbacteria bacterium]
MERKSILLSIVALAVLAALAAVPAQAEQRGSRTSQGNNIGVYVNRGWGGPFTNGPWQWPRGSANNITFNTLTHAIAVAQDINGDGTAEDTVGVMHMREISGSLASLESKAIIEAEAAAGSNMEGRMNELRYNRVWTNLDPDELAAWPIEGRIPRGDPNGAPNVASGGETMFVNMADVFYSYGYNVGPMGAAYQYTLRFLNFAESNNMVYGNVFARNMSEYAKYNPNATYKATGQAHPDGWTWKGAVLVTNHRNAAFGSGTEGWALKASKEILCFYSASPTVGGWTPPRAPLFGLKFINPPHTADQTMKMTSIHHVDWSAEFGFTGHKQIFVGFPYGVYYLVALDKETGYYPGVTNPWTGEPLRGAWPGMLQEEDARYAQWIWAGPSSFMTYACYGELHDIAPRDTITWDFTYAITYPGLESYVRPEMDLVNIDDPVMQQVLNPIEDMMVVAEVVINGNFALPTTPTSPPLTIIPGDRQVSITWSDVNLQTADPYYYFLQENPALDPDHLYREYDFEGFRVYRSYVGPNDSHSQLLANYSLSANSLQFHYIDRNEDDQPLFRMRNGMKVWYAVVPYDRNYDPATGASFSLPDPASGKTWNRPGATLYTVIPRSDASNYEAAELLGYEYVKPSGFSAEPITVTGTTLTGAATGPAGVTWLTQDPVYIVPAMTPVFDAVNSERITQDQTFYLQVSDDLQPNGNRAGRRFVVLADASVNVQDDSGPFIQVRGGSNSVTAYHSGMSSEGVTWNVKATFQGKRQGNVWTQIDAGGYTDSLSINNNRSNWNAADTRTYNGTGIYQGLLRTGGYEITWQNSGGSVTVAVVDKTHGATVPFSPYIDGGGWGFIAPGVAAQTFSTQWGRKQGGPRNVEITQSSRTAMLVQTLPATNTSPFTLFVNGQFLVFTMVQKVMPPNGTVMKLRTAFGAWSGTTFTQNPDIINPGDKWRFDIQGMTIDKEDADMSRIKVVPNPYMASSFLDLSINNRRIDFVNLPDRCTIRIYTLRGNLVNVLNHVGVNRQGWGNYTDWDRLTSVTSEPSQYTGYDNHGGTEPWNLRNRWGQTVASGLYFFHVTDQRGETLTGKFYIVN